jgi:HEPN domain-containing protein
MREADVATWLRFSEDDIRWADAGRNARLYSRSRFAAQQSVEKALKAFLPKTTGLYPRVHSLLALLDLARSQDPSLEKLKTVCDALDKYYTPVRYPDARLPEDFHLSEADAAIENASILLDEIRSRIAKL